MLIENLLKIYSNVGEPFPKWLLREVKEDKSFVEIGLPFYNYLVQK